MCVAYAHYHATAITTTGNMDGLDTCTYNRPNGYSARMLGQTTDNSESSINGVTRQLLNDVDIFKRDLQSTSISRDFLRSDGERTWTPSNPVPPAEYSKPQSDRVKLELRINAVNEILDKYDKLDLNGGTTPSFGNCGIPTKEYFSSIQRRSLDLNKLKETSRTERIKNDAKRVSAPPQNSGKKFGLVLDTNPIYETSVTGSVNKTSVTGRSASLLDLYDNSADRVEWLMSEHRRNLGLSTAKNNSVNSSKNAGSNSVFDVSAIVDPRSATGPTAGPVSPKTQMMTSPSTDRSYLMMDLNIMDSTRSGRKPSWSELGRSSMSSLTKQKKISTDRKTSHKFADTNCNLVLHQRPSLYVSASATGSGLGCTGRPILPVSADKVDYKGDVKSVRFNDITSVRTRTDQSSKTGSLDRLYDGIDAIADKFSYVPLAYRYVLRKNHAREPTANNSALIALEESVIKQKPVVGGGNDLVERQPTVVRSSDKEYHEFSQTHYSLSTAGASVADRHSTTADQKYIVNPSVVDFRSNLSSFRTAEKTGEDKPSKTLQNGFRSSSLSSEAEVSTAEDVRRSDYSHNFSSNYNRNNSNCKINHNSNSNSNNTNSNSSNNGTSRLELNHFTSSNSTGKFSSFCANVGLSESKHAVSLNDLDGVYVSDDQPWLTSTAGSRGPYQIGSRAQKLAWEQVVTPSPDRLKSKPLMSTANGFSDSSSLFPDREAKSCAFNPGNVTDFLGRSVTNASSVSSQTNSIIYSINAMSRLAATVSELQELESKMVEESLTQGNNGISKSQMIVGNAATPYSVQSGELKSGIPKPGAESVSEKYKPWLNGMQWSSQSYLTLMTSTNKFTTAASSAITTVSTTEPTRSAGVYKGFDVSTSLSFDTLSGINFKSSQKSGEDEYVDISTKQTKTATLSSTNAGSKNERHSTASKYNYDSTPVVYRSIGSSSTAMPYRDTSTSLTSVSSGWEKYLTSIYPSNGRNSTNINKYDDKSRENVKPYDENIEQYGVNVNGNPLQTGSSLQEKSTHSFLKSSSELSSYSSSPAVTLGDGQEYDRHTASIGNFKSSQTLAPSQAYSAPSLNVNPSSSLMSPTETWHPTVGITVYTSTQSTTRPDAYATSHIPSTHSDLYTRSIGSNSSYQTISTFQTISDASTCQSISTAFTYQPISRVSTYLPMSSASTCASTYQSISSASRYQPNSSASTYTQPTSRDSTYQSLSSASTYQTMSSASIYQPITSASIYQPLSTASTYRPITPFVFQPSSCKYQPTTTTTSLSHLADANACQPTDSTVVADLLGTPYVYQSLNSSGTSSFWNTSANTATTATTVYGHMIPLSTVTTTNVYSHVIPLSTATTTNVYSHVTPLSTTATTSWIPNQTQFTVPNGEILRSIAGSIPPHQSVIDISGGGRTFNNDYVSKFSPLSSLSISLQEPMLNEFYSLPDYAPKVDRKYSTGVVHDQDHGGSSAYDDYSSASDFDATPRTLPAVKYNRRRSVSSTDSDERRMSVADSFPHSGARTSNGSAAGLPPNAELFRADCADESRSPFSDTEFVVMRSGEIVKRQYSHVSKVLPQTMA